MLSVQILFCLQPNGYKHPCYQRDQRTAIYHSSIVRLSASSMSIMRNIFYVIVPFILTQTYPPLLDGKLDVLEKVCEVKPDARSSFQHIREVFSSISEIEKKSTFAGIQKLILNSKEKRLFIESHISCFLLSFLCKPNYCFEVNYCIRSQVLSLSKETIPFELKSLHYNSISLIQYKKYCSTLNKIFLESNLIKEFYFIIFSKTV